jgi:4'-phosphopantetheinyl transferase
MLALTLAHASQLQPQAADIGLNCLHPSERQRWQSFGSSKRRDEFLCGHWLMRQLLQQELGGQCSDWEIESHPGQPPRLVGMPQLFLSISHSHGWLAAAVADTPLGIDIERQQQRDNLPQLLQMVAHEREQQAIASLAGAQAQASGFTRSWTLKEAWLKQHGYGLDYELMRRLQYVAEEPEHANAQSWQSTEHSFWLALVHAEAGSCQASGLDLQPGGCWHIAPAEPDCAGQVAESSASGIQEAKQPLE